MFQSPFVPLPKTGLTGGELSRPTPGLMVLAMSGFSSATHLPCGSSLVPSFHNLLETFTKLFKVQPEIHFWHLALGAF